MKPSNRLVTSKEILERTGLRSSKTLTRWHQQGIIPKPTVKTHPSGRGKIAYWPGWVVGRCQRIIELRGQGMSLWAAAAMIRKERVENIVRTGTEEQLAESLKEVFAPLKDPSVTREDAVAALESARAVLPWVEEISTPETSPINTFLALVLTEIEALTSDQELQDAVLTDLHKERALDRVLECLIAGFRAVLVFNRSHMAILADVLLPNYMAGHDCGSSGHFLLPLDSIAQHLFSEYPSEPARLPPPRFQRMEDGKLVEYELEMRSGENLDLDIVRRRARRIGEVTAPPTEEGAA